MMRGEEADPHWRVLHDLCSMIAHLLPLSPPPRNDVASSSSSSSATTRETASCWQQWPWTTTSCRQQLSPASFASLFVGISLAMMVFGLVIFAVGLILMPWVVGLVFIFYLAGLVSSLSFFCRSFLSWPSPQHDASAWKYL